MQYNHIDIDLKPVGKIEGMVSVFVLQARG
jgi:hypothetical protein